MGDVVEKINSKKLTVKDLIFAGTFAAIYLVAVLGIMMVVGSVPILYLLCPCILGVLLGSIYLLSVTKVRKFGAALIIELLFACISTGFDPIAFSVCVISAVLAEICILIGKYKSKKWYAISYVFFNIGTAANFIRIFFAKDAYIANLQQRAGGAFADEWESIKKAMLFRGIKFDLKNLLLKPARTIEYILVPLLFSSMSLMEELASSAMARGLDSNRKRSCYSTVKMKFRDYAVLFLFLGFIVTSLVKFQ